MAIPEPLTEPLPIHEVPMAKHPDEIDIPCEKVEVAFESDWIPLPLTARPPLNVVVERLVTFNDPRVEVAANKLDELAVVAKKFVEVAFVVVEFRPVNFWSVDEPFTRSVPNDVRAANRLDELAVVAKKVVDVALVVVLFPAVKF